MPCLSHRSSTIWRAAPGAEICGLRVSDALGAPPQRCPAHCQRLVVYLQANRLSGPAVDLDHACARTLIVGWLLRKFHVRGRSGANSTEDSRKTSPTASTVPTTKGHDPGGFQRDCPLKTGISATLVRVKIASPPPVFPYQEPLDTGLIFFESGVCRENAAVERVAAAV
jgi:hypothetical protein